MKDILKMVQFDYIAGERLLPLVLIAFVLCSAVAVLLTPLAAAVLIPFAVCIFLPVQSMAARCGFNKFYGIIPVPRSSITKAAFLEYTVSAFAGELIALLIHTAAKKAKIYLSVRQAFTDTLALDDTLFGSEQSAALVVILFAVISIFVCYMRMMSDLFGQENEAKTLIITVFVLLVIAMPVIVLRIKDMIPPMNDLLPRSFGGKAAIACVLHLVTFGVCALMCHITVKKLANREL